MTPQDMAHLYAAAFPGARAWSAQEMSDLIAAKGGFAVTRPKGFAIGRVIVGEAELITLATDPTARRRGTGRALLSAFEARAIDAQATAAFLEVAADNAAARALYAQADWTETGLRRGYYQRDGSARVDAILMTKQLG